MTEDWTFAHLKRVETLWSPQGYHRYPAKFIPQLVHRIIEVYSAPGDLIGDPFLGSATTGIEALRMGRHFWGSGISQVALLISRAMRQHRHELFDETFQEELAGLYQDSPLGQPPIAPAQLALATILQAYVGISDDEVIEATIMDRRWQLVLDCLDGTDSPFSKGTLVAFRKRLIEAQMARGPNT